MFFFSDNEWLIGRWDNLRELSDHEHLTIQPIALSLQLGSKHRTQTCWPELSDWSSFLIRSRLLKNEDVRQGDDF
jgi:hypothetical protein